MQGANPVTRQRFGDSNQAIYQHSSQTDGVTTDPFPGAALLKTIPNSHRFAQQIADFANPLAALPHGLIGLGPREGMINTDTSGKHAIFLFDSQTVGFVMPCYASYLRDLFSESELQTGTFTAVGAVHRPGQDDKIPRFVAHYWPAYDHELAVSEPRPGTFLQYLAIGKKLAHASGEAYLMVEKIAEGFLRLAGILNPLTEIGMADAEKKLKNALTDIDTARSALLRAKNHAEDFAWTQIPMRLANWMMPSGTCSRHPLKKHINPL